MTRKQRRLLVVVIGLALLGGATAMVLAAFSDNLVFFYSPSELAEKGIRPNQRVRIGGLVETQSFSKRGRPPRELPRHRRQERYRGDL